MIFIQLIPSQCSLSIIPGNVRKSLVGKKGNIGLKWVSFNSIMTEVPII